MAFDKNGNFIRPLPAEKEQIVKISTPPPPATTKPKQ